jgi:hypothetical protein
MHRIVFAFLTFEQHLRAVVATPQSYRPDCCPHCGFGCLWGHGCYGRKADRSVDSDLNPLPIPRYRCPLCRRTGAAPADRGRLAAQYRHDAHCAFCTSETALDIEGVLKQALLRRGVPKTLVVDNGAAYRASTLQGICAQLSIRLVHCRPYQPTSKGKLERWRRMLREQFLAELDATHIRDMAELNVRLWAWLEQVYHRRKHGALGETHTVLALPAGPAAHPAARHTGRATGRTVPASHLAPCAS